MMTEHSRFGEIVFPQTTNEALAALALGAVPLAGGTWIMRAPLRHEPMPKLLLSLSSLPELQTLTMGPEIATIGAMTTHDALALALAPHADLSGLATAAGASANPGIRRVATLAGNIATPAFSASDLAPALLAVDATIVLATKTGLKSLPIAAFLTSREQSLQGALILRVEIARSSRHAAHERLPMRKAGDYPCAILSISVDASDGLIRDIRIAIGAVEATARRWKSLEDRLKNSRFDPALAEAAARALSDDLSARDAIDAPGWYRLSVLPVLMRRAFQKLQAEV